MKSQEVKYFTGFGSDIYIPSINSNMEVEYFKIPEKEADELVHRGWFNAPEEV